MAYRFIQVGIGGFGKGWLKRLCDHPDIEIAALVDTDEERLQSARQAAGTAAESCYGDLAQALRETDADGLLCVVPPEHHRDCCVAAMNAGLDVITEKPMAATLEDCRAMAAAARETGRTCVVSQNYRYKPALWTMARLVRDGDIGAVGQVRIDFFKGHDFGGGFRHEMDNPLLVDMGVHHFDLVRFITGENAVSVEGAAWNPPWSNYRGDASAAVVFTLESGARVVYNGSWCAQGQYCDWNGNWHIEGARGALLYTDEELTINRVGARYRTDSVIKPDTASMKYTAQDYVLHDFLESMKAKRQPLTDVSDNLHSMAMVFAAVEAVRSGQRVDISSFVRLDETAQSGVKNGN